MKITLSVLKADVGSIGGHTKPSDKMLNLSCYLRLINAGPVPITSHSFSVSLTPCIAPD
jgi:fructose 1,6-bisphosphatase